MATYVDYAALATDPTFLARIGYAIVKFAVYKQGAGTVYEKTWAANALANPAAITQAIIQAVIQNADVQFGLGAVLDAALQTAVETACNALIAATTTYQWESQTAQNPAFLQRIQVAICTFAESIMAEADTVAFHSSRYQWAKNAMFQQFQMAQQIASGVVLDPNVAPTLGFTTDALLQPAVEKQCTSLLMN